MPVQPVEMEGLIDYLITLLKNRFSNQVSDFFFGDIGVYLPASFGGSRKDQKAVIAVQPAFNYLIPNERVAAQESRNLGVTVIVMVNITPFFEAKPQEAFGERILVRLTTDIATFLTQEENVTLGGRVQWSQVGDIDWAWVARGDQAIRAAGISFNARVRVPRI